MGFNDQHTLKAILEAESYDGPSIIIAYSHCINHGIDMEKGLEQQKLAVQCGLWPLYRYDPRLSAENKNPLSIDYKEPTIPVDQYMYNETRFRMLVQSDEARAEALLKLSKEYAKARWNFYSQMAAMHYDANPEPGK
jgi:pyruvate-ferredoxin/flavodoxin oxidoreductase